MEIYGNWSHSTLLKSIAKPAQTVTSDLCPECLSNLCPECLSNTIDFVHGHRTKVMTTRVRMGEEGCRTYTLKKKVKLC